MTVDQPIRDGLRWLRDQFAAWFTGSLVMVGVFLAIGAAVGVGVIWDGHFARSLSPSDALADSFQAAGYVISAMAILAVSVGVKACLDGARWPGVVFIVAGMLAAIASWSQSIGVMAISIEQKYEAVAAVENNEGRAEQANTNYLAELRQQREAARTAKASDIAQLEATISDIRDDGVDGVGRADLEEIARLQDRIEVIRTEADATIASLSADIRSELNADRDAVPETVEAPIVQDMKFNPLFPLIASFIHGSDPTDKQVRWVAVVFSVFWAVLIPVFGMLLPAYLVITRHARGKPNADRIRIGDEDFDRDWLNDAIRQRRNTLRAAKERANQPKDVEPEPLTLPQPEYLESDLYEDESDERGPSAH